MRAAIVVALALAGCARGDAPADWHLVWSDEFDGPAGARPDATRWSLEVGGDGWGNQELQFHTGENAALDGGGNLVITARREAMGARAFTSARLSTRGKLEQAFGRFEARLLLPAGKGLWPAFWMMGTDVGQVGWPGCGEIDIMEGRGAQPWRVSSALHGPGYSAGNALIAPYETPDMSRLTGDFHLFAVEWDKDELRFFVDDHRYHTARASRLPPAARWVFDHPFFLILDLAVGGNFGGPPDETTPFPSVLVADYVRVYSR
jgi:beta-glucanase (GH16 family)